MSRAMADLFCGLGGATKGFMAEGWQSTGYDLNPQPLYPTNFVQRDILSMTAADLREFDFIWASSPCEEFSVHCMKHFHPNPKHPEMGIKLFQHTWNICEQSGLPYVMENVRCAEKFVGRAVNHCGPFYLWGNAVPAVMPREMYKFVKGCDMGHFGANGSSMKTMTREEIRAARKKSGLST